MFRLVDKSSGYLFSSISLREAFDNNDASMQAEINRLDANRLLNTAPPDLAKYFVEKYTMHAPALIRDQWHADEREARIDVRYDPNRWIDDRSHPVYVPGQRIDIVVPFSGDSEFFYAQASTTTSSPPRATVREQSLVLSFEIAHDASRDIRPEIDRTLTEIERYLVWIGNDISAFNGSLISKAEQAITACRASRQLGQNG